MSLKMVHFRWRAKNPGNPYLNSTTVMFDYSSTYTLSITVGASRKRKTEDDKDHGTKKSCTEIIKID